MGYVQSCTAQAINFAATSPEKVEILVNGYLRRKIKQNRPLFGGDDMGVQSHRVTTKSEALLRQLNPSVAGVARQTVAGFMLRLPAEVNLVRQSRTVPISQWDAAMLRAIRHCYLEDQVKSHTQAYLFSHIDVHQGVDANIERIVQFGTRFEQATVAHKDFVREVVAQLSDPSTMQIMHVSKCKSEYGKWAKQCARDINNTPSPHVARLALESYFWEKLYHGGDGLPENQAHLSIKLDHLLKTLTHHRDLARWVYAEVTEPGRLSLDLSMKATVMNLDRTIERVAESQEIYPPSTSGKQVIVDLNRMSGCVLFI